MPVLGGILWVGGVFMFNIFTIAFLLEAFDLDASFIFEKKYKYIFSFFLILLLLFYSSYKGRHKKIIAHYEEKERIAGKAIPPLIIVLFYNVTSLKAN
jgi:hypothetical protein